MDCQDDSTVCAERKKGQHLGMAERGAIIALKQHGLGTRAIAREIGCVPSTITNELRRGTPARKSSKGYAIVRKKYLPPCRTPKRKVPFWAGEHPQKLRRKTKNKPRRSSNRN